MTATNEQIYLTVRVPVLFNAVLIGLLMAYFNVKFDGVYAKFDAKNKRLDDMRDLWRA